MFCAGCQQHSHGWFVHRVMFFILYYREDCGERIKRRRGLSLRVFCGRAMNEDGDLLDTSLPLLAGLMLETLGDLEEAAVR